MVKALDSHSRDQRFNSSTAHQTPLGKSVEKLILIFKGDKNMACDEKDEKCEECGEKECTCPATGTEEAGKDDKTSKETGEDTTTEDES